MFPWLLCIFLLIALVGTGSEDAVLNAGAMGSGAEMVAKAGTEVQA